MHRNPDGQTTHILTPTDQRPRVVFGGDGVGYANPIVQAAMPDTLVNRIAAGFERDESSPASQIDPAAFADDIVLPLTAGRTFPGDQADGLRRAREAMERSEG